MSCPRMRNRKRETRSRWRKGAGATDGARQTSEAVRAAPMRCWLPMGGALGELGPSGSPSAGVAPTQLAALVQDSVAFFRPQPRLGTPAQIELCSGADQSTAASSGSP
eukprot:2073096-Alexandrium_andersonii.AAC.1